MCLCSIVYVPLSVSADKPERDLTSRGVCLCLFLGLCLCLCLFLCVCVLTSPAAQYLLSCVVCVRERESVLC